MLPTIGLVLLLTCTTIFNVSPTKADELKTYIVHLSLPKSQDFSEAHEIEEWYNSFLSKVPSSSNEKPKMVFAYRHVLTGFAAKMSVDQVKAIKNLNGVASVNPDDVYQLQTTRSPRFLGLRQDSGLWKGSNLGKGAIIGVIDTGITTGHPSFHDKDVPAPPSTWKGKCEVAGCNNKLIGIRSFVNGSTPIDTAGHGTHTASTAAGNFVDNANVFGMANGTASGVAPLAHLAIYKACGSDSCSLSAILASMDAAIEDGVDVMSLSLGRDIPVPFDKDPLAIGAFSAMQKGIFVSFSAGNGGPQNTSTTNNAPWTLTVGASTIDRRIRTSVLLGNKKVLDGESLYQPKDFDHKRRPLVYPGKDGDKSAASCASLDSIDVKGKVVLCDAGYVDNIKMGQFVKDAGGAAMIIANHIFFGETIFAQAHVLPASFVGYKEGVEIKKYLNSTSSPVATILFRGTVVGLKTDPQVPFFSSRGPNFASPGILKPDIVGPGVEILAAWPDNVVDNQTGTTKATFQIDSGTSMSCPHLAGIAALLKSAHPEWSPAAIKSAIMTTGSQVSRDGHAIMDERALPADVFAIGSGHVNPPKANEPGLVFDIQPDDYIPYLCGLGYTATQVQQFAKKKVNCSKTIPEAQLNYPSFAVSLKRGDIKTYSRTFTNVGMADSTYTIKDVSVPQGVSVRFGLPSQVLSFTSNHQKLTLDILFTRDVNDKVRGPYDQGHITWVSGKYTVRIPISFKFE